MKVIVTYMERETGETWQSQFYFDNREQYSEEINYFIDDQTIGIDVIEE